MTWVEFARKNRKVSGCTCGAWKGESAHRCSPWAHTNTCAQVLETERLFKEWQEDPSTNFDFLRE